MPTPKQGSPFQPLQVGKATMSVLVELPWLPRITTLASIVDAHDPYIVQWQEERDGGRRFWGVKGGKEEER